MKQHRFSILVAILSLVVLVSACVPGTGPALRVVHNQTWSASFEVETEALGSMVRFPLSLDLTFTQRFNDVDASASLRYDSFIQLKTGNLVTLQGRLALDDSLHLADGGGLFTFDGRFHGDYLTGTVAIAGLVPVGNVTFTRTN